MSSYQIYLIVFLKFSVFYFFHNVLSQFITERGRLKFSTTVDTFVNFSLRMCPFFFYMCQVYIITNKFKTVLTSSIESFKFR